MSDTQKPLPCPFCSAAPHVSSRMAEDLATHDQVVWHSVQCVNCGMASVEIPNGYDGGTATERWNRRATPPEDNRLKEALEKLQAFFDAVTGHCFGGACAFEYGSDLDYGEFLDLAEKAGLLRTEEYDPDKHGSGADCAPGDTWYVPTNIGRDALSRATKGGDDDEG